MNRPLAVGVCMFIAGLLSAKFDWIIYIFITALAVLFIVYFIKNSKKNRAVYLILYMFFFLLMYIFGTYKGLNFSQKSIIEYWTSEIQTEKSFVTGTISNVYRTSSGYKYIVKVTSIYEKDTTSVVSDASDSMTFDDKAQNIKLANISELTAISDASDSMTFDDKEYIAVYYSEYIPYDTTIRIYGELYLYSLPMNEGEFNLYNYNKARNIQGYIYADDNKIETLTTQKNLKHKLNTVVYKFRSLLIDGINIYFNDDNAGILISMITGDKSYLDSEIKEMYSKVGFAHILAISGVHISVVGLMLFKLLRKKKTGYVASSVITLIILCLYYQMTGGQVSCERAIIMLLFTLTARCIGRKADYLTSLAFAAFIVLVKQPYCIFDISFLMSFSAGIGIYIYSRYMELKKKLMPASVDSTKNSEKDLKNLIKKLMPASFNSTNNSQIDSKRSKNNLNYISSLRLSTFSPNGITNRSETDSNLRTGTFSPNGITKRSETDSNLIDKLVFTLCIQISLIPIQMMFFYTYCPYSIVLNLILLPYVNILLISGILSGFIGGVYSILNIAQGTGLNIITFNPGGTGLNIITFNPGGTGLNIITFNPGGIFSLIINLIKIVVYIFGEFIRLPACIILFVYNKVCTFALGLPYSNIAVGHITIYKAVFYLAMLLIWVLLINNMYEKLLGIKGCNGKKGAVNQNIASHSIASDKGNNKNNGNINENTASHSIASDKECNKKEGFRNLRLTLIPLMLAFLILIPHHGSDLKIAQLYVGQGDCCIITKGNNVIMIDGGSTDKADIYKYTIKPYLNYMGYNSIDIIFISHADEDHVSGIVDLLKNTNTSLSSSIQSNSNESTKLLKNTNNYTSDSMQSNSNKSSRLFNARNITTKIVIPKLEDSSSFNNKGITDISYEMTAGDKLQLDDLLFTCLYPDESNNSESDNDTSLVLMMTYGNFNMLFMGDLSSDYEEAVIKYAKESGLSNSTVLKVGHHGSRYSTSEKLLEYFNPIYSVISCGINNSYGHPTVETLSRLKEAESKIYRTDEQGEVILNISSRGVNIFCFRSS